MVGHWETFLDGLGEKDGTTAVTRRSYPAMSYECLGLDLC
jgi:hypothetical protein